MMLTWFALPLLVLVGGVAMLWLGLRGRRVDDHPLCRACGFDLIGRPEGSDKCAECGADLTSPRAIRHGHRRRRPVMLTFGLVIVLLFVGVAGVIGWSRAREFDRYQVMPTWYLLREARDTSGGLPVAAWQELRRRLGNGKLSKDHNAAAIEAALTIQGDRARPWHASIGDFVEVARKRGDVDDAQWARYARQAVGVTVTLRPQVRRGGDDLPARIAAGSARVGNNAGLSVRVNDPIVARGDLIKPQRKMTGSGYVGFGLYPGGGGAYSGRSFQLDDKAAAAAPLGPREATFRGRLSVVESGSAEDKPPLAEWEEEVKATWELVAADAETVKLIDDESHRAAVEQGTRIQFLGTRASEDPKYLSLKMNFTGIPVALAHDVLLREPGGRERRLTSITLRPGNMGYSTGGIAENLEADRVDVIFRPDPHGARHTVDVTELWNHEFVIKNVAVQRPPPATKPATKPNNTRAATPTRRS
jgi:hypothetical protein